MKRILLCVVLTIIALGLFAQITPYGSARMGYWYENRDEDYLGGDNSRLSMNYGLQTNSRFGVDYKTRYYVAKVELGYTGGDISARHLYVKRDFGCWKLTVGQTEDGTNQLANQAWNNDNGLIGYGVVYGGRNPQIRADFNFGLYLALIKPSVILPEQMPATYSSGVDNLIPKINIGYNFKIGNVYFMPTAVVQTYSFNKDFCDTDVDVNSWLGQLVFDYPGKKIQLKGGFHYGANIGNMGYAAPRINYAEGKPYDSNKAFYADNNTADATTMGGFAALGLRLTDTWNLNLGGGYANTETSSEHPRYPEEDDRMSFYLQLAYKGACGLRIIPEIGMVDDGKGLGGDEQGSLMYFGTQVRFDF